MDEEDLDRRITTSDFLRPVVASMIQEEYSTSLECVDLCNAIIWLLAEFPAAADKLKQAVREIRSELKG